MSTIVVGYVLSIISSLFSALYVLPKKISGQKPVIYAALMGAGYFAASVIGYAVLAGFHVIDEPILFPHAAIACINGVIWMIASVSVLISIDQIGLAKSNQWKGLQGPIGSILMLVFFSEFRSAKLIYMLLAIVLITLAALMFSTRDHHNVPVQKTGIVYALVSAVFFGISAALWKLLTDEGAYFNQQIYQSLFITLSAVLYTRLKYGTLKLDTRHKKREIILPIIGGLLFFGNASFNLLANRYIEASIAFMLHQLNTIWLFLFGVFVFHEINFKKHWIRLLTGLMLSAIGVFMLVLAKV